MDRRSHRMLVTASQQHADELGHVNNAVYLVWVEACCREHAMRVGLPTERLLRLGVVPVVRRHVLTYRRSARPGDRLRITTTITWVRGPLASRHNEVRGADGEELILEVDTDWVWIDPESGKPKAPPAEIVGAFGLDPAGPGQESRSVTSEEGSVRE